MANRLVGMVAAIGFSGILVFGSIGTALAEEIPTRSITQAEAYDQGNGGYYAEATGEHEIKVTLSNASFRLDGNNLQVISPQGKVTETLGSKIKSSTGQKLDASYELISPHEARIHYSDTKVALPGGWDYVKCVGKSAAGGAAGGCVAGAISGEGVGCIPGAGAGGIAGGVSGLITCA